MMQISPCVALLQAFQPELYLLMRQLMSPCSWPTLPMTQTLHVSYPSSMHACALQLIPCCHHHPDQVSQCVSHSAICCRQKLGTSTMGRTMLLRPRCVQFRTMNDLTLLSDQQLPASSIQTLLCYLDPGCTPWGGIQHPCRKGSPQEPEYTCHRPFRRLSWRPSHENPSELHSQRSECRHLWLPPTEGPEHKSKPAAACGWQ